jgi:hypothetical protein
MLKHRSRKSKKKVKKIPLCIYVDNSNIYIGGQQIAKRKRENSLKFRIAFRNFLFLITRGKKFDELVWAGSGPPELKEVFGKSGIDVQLIPRPKGGEKELVDQAIQLSMHRHTRKYKKTPGVIVLCTGDGKGYEHDKGFLYDVKEFISEGWKLHLYSWDCICNRKLKQFAKQKGTFVPLEKYYHSITFIQDGRKVQDLKLS